MAIYKLSRRKLLIVGGTLALTSIAKGSVDLENVVRNNEERLAKYRWAMFIDTEKCKDCAEPYISRGEKPPCVVACDREYNVPDFPDDELRDPQWLKIIKLKSEIGDEIVYLPLMCQHCEHPACAEVCLSKATFKRPDGLVLIDYHRCIGCRYCIIACPFGARSFNWYPPLHGLPEGKPINLKTQLRGHGVVEKCTFCMERIDEEIERAEKEGRKPNPIPACVEACNREGNGALIFGDLFNPESELYKAVTKYHWIKLRAELGTNPSVYYKL